MITDLEYSKDMHGKHPCISLFRKQLVNKSSIAGDAIGLCTNETLTVRSQRFIHSSGYPAGYPVGYRCKLQLTGGHGMVQCSLFYTFLPAFTNLQLLPRAMLSNDLCPSVQDGDVKKLYVSKKWRRVQKKVHSGPLPLPLDIGTTAASGTQSRFQFHSCFYNIFIFTEYENHHAIFAAQILFGETQLR